MGLCDYEILAAISLSGKIFSTTFLAYSKQPLLVRSLRQFLVGGRTICQLS